MYAHTESRCCSVSMSILPHALGTPRPPPLTSPFQMALPGTGPDILLRCMHVQLRSFQNKISRDADIVVAAMVSIVGSTLIFQGWRLDPLLLLCQALTTSVAVWYGMETFRLRSKEQEMVRGHWQRPIMQAISLCMTEAFGDIDHQAVQNSNILMQSAFQTQHEECSY